MRREVLLLAVVTVLGDACGQASGDAHPENESALLHADEGEPKPPDLARAAADPDLLLAVVLRRHRDGARRLGAHAFQGRHKMRVVESGKEIEALDETALVEQTAAGELHALYTNSKSYGRELYFVNNTIWVRPRWGKFHRRPPAAPDEPLRVADEIFGSLAADLELVGFSLAVKDGGETQAAGRRGRKVVLALGSARPQLLYTEEGRKWRNAITVQALEGELVLDGETGALLTGRLATRLSFQRGGRALEMILESSHAIDQIGGAVAVKPPPDAESVQTPLRSHEFEERQELLEGIAPPAAKAPVPKEGKDREGKER